MERMIGFDVDNTLCDSITVTWEKKKNARNIEFIFNVSMWHELTNKLVPNLLDLTPIWQL